MQMQTEGVEYRSYIIFREAGEFVARPADCDELQIEIAARSKSKLKRHIDVLWASCDKPADKQSPWIREIATGSLVRRIRPAEFGSAVRRRLMKVAIAAGLISGVAATAAVAKTLDFDHDGQLTLNDAFVAVNYAMTGETAYTSRFTWKGKVYKAKWHPSASQDLESVVDDLVEINTPDGKMVQTSAILTP